MTELYQWLKDEAKLDGGKLAKAEESCSDACAESVQDLKVAHGRGRLAEVFPQAIIRQKIERALGGVSKISGVIKTIASTPTKHESSRPVAKYESKGTDLPPDRDYAAFISHKKVK